MATPTISTIERLSMDMSNIMSVYDNEFRSGCLISGHIGTRQLYPNNSLESKPEAMNLRK